MLRGRGILRVLVAFRRKILNILGKGTLNMQRLSRWNQRNDMRGCSELSKDDTIIFWIKLRLCGVIGFLQDSVTGKI